MSTITPNLGLVKPQLSDVADITQMNPNWDKLDEEIGELKSSGSKIDPILLTSANDLNQITDNGFYYWRTNNKPANTPTESEANKLTAMRVWSEDGITCLQELVNMYSGNTHNCMMRRTVDAGEGYPWEWVNPPMTIGVEYRTVERYDNEPVFITLLSDGSVKKRTDYHGDLSMVAPSGNVGVAQVRNIYAGTDDMTAGTSSLTSGAIYFMYE